MDYNRLMLLLAIEEKLRAHGPRYRAALDIVTEEIDDLIVPKKAGPAPATGTAPEAPVYPKDVVEQTPSFPSGALQRPSLESK